MQHAELANMTKGWFVGNFEPTVLPSSEVEIAVKTYRAGDYEPLHHHKVATEVTVIISGRVRMSGRDFGAGAILTLAPNEATDFEVIEDAVTVVVKTPCVIGDKYPGRE